MFYSSFHINLLDDGLLYTFGEDENGKLGLIGSQLEDTTQPQPVPGLDDDKYIDVSCGARHTIAITIKGRCYSFGDGSHGQLGHGTMVQEISEPKQIEQLSSFKIVWVSCGESHTSVVTGMFRNLHFYDLPVVLLSQVFGFIFTKNSSNQRGKLYK